MNSRKTTIFLSFVLIIILILLFIKPCAQQEESINNTIDNDPVIEDIIAAEPIVVEKKKELLKKQPKQKQVVKKQPVKKEVSTEPLPTVSKKPKKGNMPSYVNKSGFRPFYIYKEIGSNDNHYYPSGLMGNVGAININQAWKLQPKIGTTCIKVSYNAERAGIAWSGVYWMEPADNWGNKGFGFNLAGAERLSFWARGEKGNEVINNFIVGGIQGKDVEDSDSRSIGPIYLSTEWEQYIIDLDGADLSNIIGGFCFTVSKGNNPEGCVFYLDNIVFE